MAIGISGRRSPPLPCGTIAARWTIPAVRGVAMSGSGDREEGLELTDPRSPGDPEAGVAAPDEADVTAARVGP